MAAPDYHSIDPAKLVTEANKALDLTGNAVAQGATIAPDYVMRLVIAAREILNRHAPELCRHCPESRQHHECAHCGVGGSWPCPDAEALFKVLAVGEEDE